jgi:hypothetical protein
MRDPVVPNTRAIPFTLEQHEQLRRWGDQRPCGLSLRVVWEDALLEEVAEVYYDPLWTLYSITHRASGMIEVDNMHHALQLVGNLAAALALVEALEGAARRVADRAQTAR